MCCQLKRHSPNWLRWLWMLPNLSSREFIGLFILFSLAPPLPTLPAPILKPAMSSSTDQAQFPPRNRRRRTRTIYTPEQLSSMEAVFASNQYPDINSREALADAVDLTEARVQVRHVLYTCFHHDIHIYNLVVWCHFDAPKQSFTLEWQVFCDKVNTEKSRKLSTKRKTRKIAENNVFATQSQKNPRKSLCLEYFKVNFIVRNLRNVKLLLNFNKKIILYLSMWYVCRYAYKHCIPQNTLRKIPEHSENYNCGK